MARQLTDKELAAFQRQGAKITVTKKARPKKKAAPPKPAPVDTPEKVQHLKDMVQELRTQNETLKKMVEVLSKKQIITAVLAGEIEVTQRDEHRRIKRVRPVPTSAGVQH